MRTIYLSIIAISCISLVLILPQAFAYTKESIPNISDTQFQLRVNQTISLESYNIIVNFLNVTEDSRCPSGVTCVWQGEVKIFVNIIENKQDLGDFSLTSRAGENNLAIQVFDGHLIQMTKIEPYPISNKKILLSDYVATFVISKSVVLSPLKAFKSGVAIENITCKEGFELIEKKSDNSPACVRPQTAQKLVERDWGMIKISNTS